MPVFRPRNPQEERRIAEGIERLINRYAKHKKTGSRWVRFNAWWRDGKGLNASLDKSSGWVTDWTTGEKLGGKEMAAIAGLTLPELLDGIAGKPPPPPPPPRVEPKGVDRMWQRVWGSGLDEETEACLAVEQWIRVRRNFGDGVGRVSGWGGIDVGDVSRVCGDNMLARQWMADYVGRVGCCAVAPIRDSVSGDIVNIHFRPIKGGERRSLPGVSHVNPANDAPRGYGHCHRINSAKRVILVEGMADTWAVESFIKDTESCVVGVISTSTAKSWVAMLHGARDVVLVPQLDPARPICQSCGEQAGELDVCPHCRRRHQPGRQSQRAFGSMLASLRRLETPARWFAWGAFARAARVDARAAKDIAGVIELAGWQKACESFLPALEAQ